MRRHSKSDYIRQKDLRKQWWSGLGHMTITVEVFPRRKKNVFSIFFPCAYYRGSHRTSSERKGVLNSFTLFAGNHVRWRLQHACITVNIAKFLRKSILKNICKRLRLLPKLWLYCFLALYSFKLTKRSHFSIFTTLHANSATKIIEQWHFL